MTALEQLAPGVHVWEPPGGLSNSTVLGAGAGALCVDLQARPSLAARLLDEVRDRLGPLGSTVLTHAHADHMLGAAAFDDVPLIAQRAAAEAISERGEDERALLRSVMTEHAEELEGAVLPNPKRIVEDSYTVQLDDRDVRLIAVGPAHTPGDLVAFDTASGVLVAGDLVFNGYFPVFRDASCAGWLDALERLIDLAPSHVVPGHGPVASAGCLVDMIELLSELKASVAEALNQGVPRHELPSVVAGPERFEHLRRPDRIGMAIDRIADELLRS